MTDLRPMELGEILDGALTIYRQRFRLFVRLGVVALAAPALLTVYIEFAGGQIQHVILSLVTLLLQGIAGYFLTAGAIRIISDSYLGRDPQFADAVAMGTSKIWPLFLVAVGKVLIFALLGVVIWLPIVAVMAVVGKGAGAVAVGGLLSIVAGIGGGWFGIWVMCGYAVTTPVVVLEPLDGVFDSFGRSWELTRGFRGKVFLLYFVAFLIVYIPVAGLGAAAAEAGLTNPMTQHVIQVVSAAVPMVITPIIACVATLLYYDLRVRREAFDLQLLGAHLGLTG